MREDRGRVNVRRRCAAVALAAIASALVLAPSAAAIVNGKDATQANPALASIGYTFPENKNNYFDCGGALVTPTKVVTAAHCAIVDPDGSQPVSPGGYDLVLGALVDNAPGLEQFKVTKVAVNPDWDPELKHNDVAVLTLDHPATAPPMRVIYGSESELVKPGTIATIAGYGFTRDGGPTSNRLQEIQLPIQSSYTCGGNVEGLFADDAFLCAGRGDGSGSTCEGDSGSPLMVPDYMGRQTLVGIVSNGPVPCNDRGEYDDYTRLQNSKAGAWLDSQIGSHTGTPDPTRKPVDDGDDDDDDDDGTTARRKPIRLVPAGRLVLFPGRQGRLTFKIRNSTSKRLKGSATLNLGNRREGRRQFTLAAKKTTTVRVKISRRTRLRLRRAERLRMTVVARIGYAGRSVKLTRTVVAVSAERRPAR